MLHAVVRRKARRFFIVQGGRLPLEDVVTSTVFGPLAFFTPGETLRALTIGFGLEPPAWAPVSCQLDFWPRGEIDPIEPDLRVRFRGANDERLTLLIEVKWNASFGQDQALRQWREFGVRDASVHHVLLVRDRLEGTSEFGSGDAALGRDLRDSEVVSWRSRRTCLTWSDFSQRLERAPEWAQTPGVVDWAAMTVAFLAALGERHFAGFAVVVGDQDLPAQRAPLFWSNAFRWPALVLPQTPPPLFWFGDRESAT